ncbi:MAG TPA: cache domain-containing protein [Ktedonobacteraceae bacterium]|nr:cache domain-containing protein [Ktedonobacteraceae bacterium]
MSQKKSSTRKSLPLSIRISLWLIAASILPLLLALVISELQSRSTLINQASRTMETDAQTHAQLIDNYFAEKLLVLKSLDYTPLVQQYLLDPAGSQQIVPTILENGLAIQKLVDPDVTLVTFFDPRGKLLLYYSLYHLKPVPHGKYMIPPEDAQQIAKGQQFVSSVYYDPVAHKSTVELYTPVYSTTLKRLLGVVRDTLDLDTVRHIVNSENGVNGSGSYAFILDQNGVRVIDPDPTTLFTSVAPLNAMIQQNIVNENRYGKNSTIPVSADATLSSMQSQPKPPITFQEVPAGKNELFQVTRRPLSTVPWTYFVLTPVNEVIAVANQQLLIIVLIAAAIVLPVAIIGWMVGYRISSPILRSVKSLIKNSHVLNQLSEREKNASSEQVWIVEASKTGLKSQQYYTNASKIAAHRLNEIGGGLLEQRYVDTQTSLNTVKQMVSIGLYFEKAIAYQEETNNKVAAAVKVTDEVAEQLASGARSTSEAANELDGIVSQLRQIVGN